MTGELLAALAQANHAVRLLPKPAAGGDRVVLADPGAALRTTLRDFHRLRRGAPQLREAGRLLAEHGLDARRVLRSGGSGVAESLVQAVDRLLERAGLDRWALDGDAARTGG